jgi:SAM-dependent methyltransferase
VPPAPPRQHHYGSQPYLEPYHSAANKHGAEFGSLLWASPQTQAARFDAIERLGRLHRKSVLDVGCGRADLLDFLLDRDVRPADYVGLEAVEDLARAAEAKRRRMKDVRIVRGDFVRDPVKMFVAADVVVFSGSLNTLDDRDFYRTLSRAFDACADAVVFNFLCNHYLAGADYLRWRRPADVVAFASQLSPDVRTLDDYLHGDFTVALHKTEAHHPS